MKRFRNQRKKNFILVVEIGSNCVKKIIEGPDEQTLKKAELEKIDLATERKANTLFQQYSPHIHEVIRIRASDIDDLKQAFPECSGWDAIISEQLTII